MGPVRLDLTTRLARALGVLDHVDVLAPGRRDRRGAGHRPRPGLHRRGPPAPRPTPRPPTRTTGSGTEDDPAFAGMHEASARIVQGTLDICRRVWTGEAEHGVNYCGGLHHAMRTHAAGLLHLQRHRRRHPVAARQRRAAGGLRRHRRPPRRRRRADLLERPAGPDDLAPRVRPAPLPRHRLARRHRRPRRPGLGRQRRPAARHRRLRLAAGPRLRRAAARAGVRARRPRLPARLRHPRARPARAPRHHRRRPAPGARDAPRPRARGRPAGGGWRSGAGATSSSRSCRGRGRT